MILVALIAAAGALGRLLPMPPTLDRGSAEVLRALAGLSIAALVVLPLGAWSLDAAALAVYALAALALFGAYWRRRTQGSAAHPAEAPLSGWESLLLVVLTLALAMPLLATFAPVTGWDATVAHLALPEEYARAGRIYLDTGNVQSAYPHLLQSLLAVAYAGGGERSAALLTWLWSALACGGVYALGRQCFGRSAGLGAAALFATAPIFVDQAASPGVDLACAGIACSALACVLVWRDTGQLGGLVWAGALAGTSVGVRHTGLLVVALLLLGPWFWRRPLPLRGWTLCAGAALLAMAPWLLRSAWLTGNPVYPFLPGIFGEGPLPHLDVSGLGLHESTQQNNALLALLRFPYDIVMRPDHFDGISKSPGGAVLILGVPGLLLGGARAWWLGGYALAGGLAFFFFQRLARYLLPFFAVLMVVAARAPDRLGPLRPLGLLVLLASYVLGLGLHAAALSIKLPVIVGRESREAYLHRRVERYAMFDYANQFLNDGGTILSIDQRAYYLAPHAFVNHWALLPLRTLPIAEQAAWLRAQNIRYILLPVDFVAESGRLRDELQPMLEGWRRDREHFEQMTLLAPVRRDGTTERVEVLRVRTPGDA